MTKINKVIKTHTSTRNACKLCAPLGASMVLKGIEQAMPILHGSQGCATYIRRYVIGHFREPFDIASSSFTEETTVFGGGENLMRAIENIITQYNPEIIGIATTCLAETIGEDIQLHLAALAGKKADLPTIVHVSTPSYKGTHMDGFFAAVKTLVRKFAVKGTRINKVAVFPGMLSPQDYRYIKQMLFDFQLPSVVIPDFSDTLDGGSWQDYQKIPPGGTAIDDLKDCGRCCGAIEFGLSISEDQSSAEYLSKSYGMPSYKMPIPIGIENSDEFFSTLCTISGHPVPDKYSMARMRLIDAYVDGHKYAAGKSVALYGEEDLVCALASFMSEIGMTVSVCISGCKPESLRKAMEKRVPAVAASARILEDADFEDLLNAIEESPVDLIIGNSKGYTVSRKLSVPLVRVGFPIHDRLGAQRFSLVGYEGTTELFDRIINAIIEKKQESSDIGYLTW
ncbi:nitrogenase component 1 [Chitinispirillales bacterium ANBcel5]|uniref:nitrogenase component 1 n=1 Tax=Cellulosispirillum alkaliphilum TaxID=3039283 RepID=UPI002A5333E2|nr:nitrogenase component 1 [Chitinispirillales bacterium ANBcel5]